MLFDHRRRGVLALCVCLALWAVCAAIFHLQSAPETEQAALRQVPAELPAPDFPGGALYRLGVYQGQVAVFFPADEVPFHITETSVSSLPEPDQQALWQGIFLYSSAELAQRLEDYGT